MVNDPTLQKEEPAGKNKFQEIDLEKNRELYVFAKEAYADLTERIRRTEDKSAKLMALCGSLVAFGGLVGLFILDSFIPPRTALDWLSLICFSLFIFSVLAAYLSLLGTVSLTNRLRNPLNEKMVAYFDQESLPNILHALAEKNVEALNFNEKEHKRKIKKFGFGYIAIFFSLIVIAIFIALQLSKALSTPHCGG